MTKTIEVFNIDDGRGDFWLVIKDIGFKDDVNVAIDLQQAKELYTLLGQHLMDIEEETRELYNLMEEVGGAPV